jgi:hypothetical protein
MNANSANEDRGRRSDRVRDSAKGGEAARVTERAAKGERGAEEGPKRRAWVRETGSMAVVS